MLASQVSFSTAIIAQRNGYVIVFQPKIAKESLFKLSHLDHSALNVQCTAQYVIRLGYCRCNCVVSIKDNWNKAPVSDEFSWLTQSDSDNKCTLAQSSITTVYFLIKLFISPSLKKREPQTRSQLQSR